MTAIFNDLFALNVSPLVNPHFKRKGRFYQWPDGVTSCGGEQVATSGETDEATEFTEGTEK
jgi:hypothetical protein